MQEERLTQYDKLSIVFAVLYPIIPAYFKLGVSVTYLLYVFIIIAAFISHRNRFAIQKSIVIFSLILWFFVNIFLYFYHQYYMGAIWTVLLAVALVLFSANIKSATIFKKIIMAICYAVGVVCIFGIIESVTGFNIWVLFNNSDAEIMYNDLRFGMMRIVSFTYQTISYCTFLVLVSVLIFYAMTLSQTKRAKLHLKIIYVLVCINVVLTLSRSAMLVFVVAQLLMLYKMGFVTFIKRVLQIIGILVVALVFLSLANPEVFSMIQNVYYMLVAVFDSDYTSLIASKFGNDNLDAVGTRLLIYDWVIETVGDKIALGVGYSTPFRYEFTIHTSAFSYSGIKSAIEVQYLMTLYKSGVVGLVVEVGVFAGIIISSLKNGFKTAQWENKVSFNYVMFVAMLCLVIQYFSVNQSSEQNMFFLIIALFLGYNINHKFES